jgi:AcrR family transcriptional regulator
MDKRAKLFESALRLFVEFGFHNTPTSKIAKEAGLSSGTLFYFFPTKDDLVVALYLDIKTKLGCEILESIANEKSYKEIFKKYYEGTLNWAKHHKAEFKFLEQFNSSPYLKKIAEEEIQKHIKPLKELLKNGINEGIIKPMDIEIILTLISGHTFAVNQYLLSSGLSDNQRNEVISETFGLIWAMIAQTSSIE